MRLQEDFIDKLKDREATDILIATLTNYLT